MAYIQNTDGYDKNEKKGLSVRPIVYIILLIIVPSILLLYYNYKDFIFSSSAPEKENIERENSREKAIISEDNEKPFMTVEQMPSFPGGEAEMHKYIASNLKYPEKAKEEGIQGRVTVRFVVSKQGDITNTVILRGIDPECDKEVVRMLKSMPRWIPGSQDGKTVPVYYTIPIIFKLNN